MSESIKELLAVIAAQPAPKCIQCKADLDKSTVNYNGLGEAVETTCSVCVTKTERAKRTSHAHKYLPESFQWAAFDATELPGRVLSRQAIAEARTALLAPRVVFMGPAGSGKSSLAAAALRARYVENGARYAFEPAYLLAIARSRLSHHASSEG